MNPDISMINFAVQNISHLFENCYRFTKEMPDDSTRAFDLLY